MSATSGAGSVINSPLPKWQLALVVGAPVALGLGYMYYKNSTKSTSKNCRCDKSKSLSKKNGTATDKQISIDGEHQSKDSQTIPNEAETPLKEAQRYKIEGNNHFKMGKYDEAIAQYNNAIEICPKENTAELATFYQNRAAAYEQLKKYSAVKEDCTRALELNPKYTKALLRRAHALEHSNNLESALEDVTAACFFGNFTNQAALLTADRILKQLGKQHAQEYLKNKKYIMPSKHFIKSYVSSFHMDPVFSSLQDLYNDENVTSGFKKIIKALMDQNYDDIIPFCTEELEREKLSTQTNQMDKHILLLRATFYLLLGKHDVAIEDFETIINDESIQKELRVNALVKKATLYMQLEKPEKSISDFEMAKKLDPNCADIYHHRAQVNLLLEKLDEAREDFQKAVDLNPNSGVVYAQKCYADYRHAVATRQINLIKTIFKNFEEAIKNFPGCSECCTLYAQVLSETQEYQEADSFFVEAIGHNPENAVIYVHRALLWLQWNGNVDAAIKYINKALELDDKCEFGYETLGTIEVQRGNFENAIQLFDKALILARTSLELTHIFSLKDAAKTQLTIRDRFCLDNNLE